MLIWSRHIAQVVFVQSVWGMFSPGKGVSLVCFFDNNVLFSHLISMYQKISWTYLTFRNSMFVLFSILIPHVWVGLASWVHNITATMKVQFVDMVLFLVCQLSMCLPQVAFEIDINIWRMGMFLYHSKCSVLFSNHIIFVFFSHSIRIANKMCFSPSNVDTKHYTNKLPICNSIMCNYLKS